MTDFRVRSGAERQKAGNGCRSGKGSSIALLVDCHDLVGRDC